MEIQCTLHVENVRMNNLKQNIKRTDYINALVVENDFLPKNLLSQDIIEMEQLNTCIEMD